MAYFTIIIVVGLLFMLLGLYFLRARILFIKYGIETEATVIRIELSEKESNTSDEMVTLYRPHFKLITHNNQEIKFIHGDSTEWGKWSIGDKIRVIYNDAAPGMIVVCGFWDSYGRAVILFVLAFVLITGGCIGYLIT